MKNQLSVVTVSVSIFFFLFAIESFAERGMGKGSGGWGMASEYSRMYDVKTVETVKGEVVSVDEFSSRGMSPGVHAVLKTEKETIAVHLGPQWFMEKQDTEIKAKDAVEVKGSRITYEGKPAIIAAEVNKGDVVLKLRDENGIPVWAGWRRR